jgi:hypothetical protein
MNNKIKISKALLDFENLKIKKVPKIKIESTKNIIVKVEVGKFVIDF